jgi:hypothetical protein
MAADTKRMSSQAIDCHPEGFMAIESISTQAMVRIADLNRALVLILPESRGKTIHAV